MVVSFPSSDEFNIKPCNIAGEVCFLITPKISGVKWNKHNLIYRSLIVDSLGNIISAGLPKFHDVGVHPEICELPKDLKYCRIVTKLDGSLIIVSKYKGEFIIRTRGTVSVLDSLATGLEIDCLVRQKYSQILGYSLKETWDFSLLFEYTTPNQQIVVNYGTEPELYLIGKVNHEDYSLAPQIILDDVALTLRMKRPEYYEFENLSQLFESVKAWKGKEGVVIYLPEQKGLLRLKSDWYQNLHQLRSNLTTETLADLWFTWNQPEFKEFEKLFTESWNEDAYNWAKKAICSLFDGIKEYRKILAHLKEKVESRKHMTRKDFAIAAKAEYGDTKKFSVAMSLFLGTPIKQEILKHILLQNAKQCELGMFKNIETKEL